MIIATIATAITLVIAVIGINYLMLAKNTAKRRARQKLVQDNLNIFGVNDKPASEIKRTYVLGAKDLGL